MGRRRVEIKSYVQNEHRILLLLCSLELQSFTFQHTGKKQVMTLLRAGNHSRLLELNSKGKVYVFIHPLAITPAQVQQSYLVKIAKRIELAKWDF